MLKKKDAEKASVRIEVLSRLGWKWAVLVSAVGKLPNTGLALSTDVITLIRVSRNKIESGCYSACEIACDLDQAEAKHFPSILKLGPEEGDKLLALIGKAMSGKITKEDIDLGGVRPILPDCAILPCVCNY